MRLPPPPTQALLETKPKILNMGTFVHGHQAVRRWQVPFWQMNLHRFHGELLINQHERIQLHPGSATLIAPKVLAEYHYHGPSPCLWVHFTFPESPVEESSLPMFYDLGHESNRIGYALEEAISYFSVSPVRSTVRFWDILWLIVGTRDDEMTTLDSSAAPVKLQKVMQHIELHLDSSLPVSDLTAIAELSHNHLLRLFRKHTGRSILGYIRERRVRRARHLLEHSGLPTKTIATDCGFKDLYRLSKNIKQETGKSPGMLR